VISCIAGSFGLVSGATAGEMSSKVISDCYSGSTHVATTKNTAAAMNKAKNIKPARFMELS
jgi:hypothetical protein